MNKKLLVIPTIVLSSALLLTGCTGGGKQTNPHGNPTVGSSSAPSNSDGSSSKKASGYVQRPENMDGKYKPYFYAPQTTNEQSWSIYKSIGSTTYKEDPSARSTTLDEWVAMREDKKNFEKFDKLYGEMSSDTEQTALNISDYLKKNSSATLDEIKNKKELVVNRYEQVGHMSIEQDSSTGFYFVIFALSDVKKGLGYGILVPQEGKTPDFNAVK